VGGNGENSPGGLGQRNRAKSIGEGTIPTGQFLVRCHVGEEETYINSLCDHKGNQKGVEKRQIRGYLKKKKGEKVRVKAYQRGDSRKRRRETRTDKNRRRASSDIALGGREEGETTKRRRNRVFPFLLLRIASGNQKN